MVLKKLRNCILRIFMCGHCFVKYRFMQICMFYLFFRCFLCFKFDVIFKNICIMIVYIGASYPVILFSLYKTNPSKQISLYKSLITVLNKKHASTEILNFKNFIYKGKYETIMKWKNVKKRYQKSKKYLRLY